eukprot:Skav219283  [mRNA]  locus=scaffold2157:132998:137736:- [translate_table: standard]
MEARRRVGFSDGPEAAPAPFGRNWAAGILEQSPKPDIRRRRSPGLPNRLLGALALLRDPKELDSEGLGKAATAAARGADGFEAAQWNPSRCAQAMILRGTNA